jgi:hypothetical protein
MPGRKPIQSRTPPKINRAMVKQRRLDVKANWAKQEQSRPIERHPTHDTSTNREIALVTSIYRFVKRAKSNMGWRFLATIMHAPAPQNSPWRGTSGTLRMF